MNHIFKKIWNKFLGRMVVVSEHAKSAGKTDNTTGAQVNSLSNVHHDEQGKNEVFSFKPLVLKSLVLSIAAITGMNVWADDNYAHTPTETALGSASGFQYSITKTAGKITAVGGINVTTTGAGTSIDDIDSFTVNGVTTTKTADPAKVAAFINAAKKGGNIAVDQFSSAVGTANIASGRGSSAVGYRNIVVPNNSSNTFGDRNNAFGSDNKNYGQINNTAMGVGNIVNDWSWGANAIGYSNTVSNLAGSALGTANTVQT